MTDETMDEQTNRRSAFRPRANVGLVHGQLVTQPGIERCKIRVISYSSKTHSDGLVDSVSELNVSGNESRTKPRRNDGPPTIEVESAEHSRLRPDEVAWMNVGIRSRLA